MLAGSGQTPRTSLVLPRALLGAAVFGLAAGSPLCGLETVRAEVATAVDELELGLAAIAAPVRGAGGEVVAALSISGPTTRMTDARIAELKPILIDEAGTSAAASATRSKERARR